jgi:voltage-gated potassium channel
VLESYKELRADYGDLFNLIEVFSVTIFTIEYLLRLWVSRLDEEVNNSRMKFAFSTYGIIDLIAIVPFYLPMIIPIDLRIVRILRLLRLLRIFKLGRFSKSLKTINQVFKETKSDLSITLFIVVILLILSSTLMYFIENEAQPEKFASIGHSLWWSIATLTTVGYGDVYPITGMGKFLSSIIALIGIGFIALPTGIISSAFIKKLQDNSSNEFSGMCQCPNCGTQFKV